MNELALLRVGWCPSAYRPMLSGDGLIVRVKPRAGTLSAQALKVIADTAATCGNGMIDLTSRANVQIRGVTDETYQTALRMLHAANLIDDAPGPEMVRNVIVDPLSGLDPALPDGRPLARALEAALAENTGLHALPAKFGFAISSSPVIADAAPCSAILEPKLHADISLVIESATSVRLTLAGEPRLIAIVAFEEAVTAACALADVFFDCVTRNSDVRRMWLAVEKFGAAEIFTTAGLAFVSRDELTPALPVNHVGPIGPAARPYAAGLTPPFGRAEATELLSFADRLAEADMAEVRVSCSRALIVPVRSSAQATHLIAWADDKGWIADPHDPRLRIEACTGAPRCLRTIADTRADAARIAADFLRGRSDVRSVHVSGCQKGCARNGAADITLVARDGYYGVVLNGGVMDAPVLAGVPPSHVVQTLRQLTGGYHA